MKLFIVSLMALSTGTALAQAPPLPDSISEVGLSASVTRTVAPDMAIIRVGVTTDRDHAAEVGQANAQTVAAIRQALKGVGIAPDSATTSGYSVQPHRDRNGHITGYTARTELNVPLRDISKVGAAIDAALGAGATDVSPLTFMASSMQAARDSAYADAIRTIYRNAAAIVAAAGGQLTKSARLFVNEQQGRVPCPTCLEDVSGRQPTIVLPGLVSFTVNVNGTFRFVRK